jgi:hypothetical protein
MPVKGDSNNSPSSASITGLIGDYKAQLLGGETLPVTRDGNTLIVEIPSGVPGETVRVVKLSPKF